MKSVLVFAPYGSYAVHHQLDAVVGRSLSDRGCRVEAIVCDSVFPDCPNAGNGDDRKKACYSCAYAAKSLFDETGVRYRPLSAFLCEEDYRRCRATVDSMNVQDLTELEINGFAVGEWALLSIYAYYMTAFLDYDDSEVQQKIRNNTYSVLLLIIAVERAFHEIKPDTLLCYNDEAYSYYKAASEIAKAQGIKVVSHERGLLHDSFQFHQGDGFLGWAGKEKASYWKKWEQVPLSVAQCREVVKYMENRSKGININWPGYYTFSPKEEERILRQKLRIPASQPIVSFFMGADWELIRSQGQFDIPMNDPVVVVRNIMNLFAKDDICLVIRHHPFLYRYNATPFMKKLIELGQERSDNVRIVMSYEPVTAYSIIWNASCVITCGSTTGLEATMLGVKSYTLGKNYYCLAGVEYVKSIELLREKVLSHVMYRKNSSVSDFKKTFRALYFILYRLTTQFKSFGFKNYYSKDIRVCIPEGLKTGNDLALDKLCNHIISGSDLYPLPELIDFERNDQEETKFISKYLAKLSKKRHSLSFIPKWKKDKIEPKVSVVRLRRDMQGEWKSSPLWHSVSKSRLTNCELLQTPVSNNAHPQKILKAMSNALLRCSGDYTVFAPDNAIIDESFFSMAVDYLECDDFTNISGIVCGIWFYDDGKIREALPEIGDHYVQPASLFDLIHDENLILPAIIIRTDEYRKAVSKMLCCGIRSIPVMLRWLLSNFVKLKLTYVNVPLVTLLPVISIKELLEKGNQSLTMNDTSAAESSFEKALMFGKQLPEAYIGLATIRMIEEKPVLAWALASQGLQTDPENKLLLHLLEKNTHAVKDYVFEDVWPAVDRIYGHLASGQEKWLFDQVRSLPNDALILEMGSYMGRSTNSMAFACVGTNRRIICVDPFTWATPNGEDYYDQFIRGLRLNGLEQYVQPVKGISHEIPLWWKDKKPDFVFIDANHLYKDVSLDFSIAYDLVAAGGRIALHDVHPSWPGCFRLWDETASRLLDGHEFCSSIASGIKTQTKIFPDTTRDYNYAEKLIGFIEKTLPIHNESALAMRTLIDTSHGDETKLLAAQNVIQNLPDVLKQILEAMVELEGGESPDLVYWLALVLSEKNEGKKKRQLLHTLRRLIEEKPNISVFLQKEYARLRDSIVHKLPTFP